MTNRRIFLLCTGLAGVAGAAGLGNAALAETSPAMVSESDPQAVAVGYHADGRQTDRARFPQYNPGDQCNGCTLFQTRVGESAGGCPIFGEKLVAATGWCNAFSVAI